MLDGKAMKVNHTTQNRVDRRSRRTLVVISVLTLLSVVGISLVVVAAYNACGRPYQHNAIGGGHCGISLTVMDHCSLSLEDGRQTPTAEIHG